MRPVDADALKEEFAKHEDRKGEQEMRLIDADTLKESVNDKKVVGRFNTIQLIDNAPTICERYRSFCMVKPERPQGKWVFDSNFTDFGNPYGTYKCSECGGHSSNKYSFCKDCGAKMTKEAENDK